MFFRRKKYRLVSVYESFSGFHFCTIIAVLESDKVSGTYTKYGGNYRKGRAISDPAVLRPQSNSQASDMK